MTQFARTRPSRLAAVMLAVALLAAVPTVSPAQTVDTDGATVRSGTRLRTGFLVQPDTVEVGDPFTFVVTLSVPADARVEWPSITDSAATVEMRAPVQVTDEGTKIGQRRERAIYLLTAWDIGTLKIGLSDVMVRIGSSVLNVPLDDASIVVRSVLPGDTTQRVPKPARELFPRVVPWWQQWWPALAVLAALALLWWIWRRRRVAKTGSVATPPLDPFASAQHEFDRLDRLGLAEAGEAGRLVALSVDILRWYLVARFPDARLSLTAEELVDAIGEDARVPRDRLQALLTDTDGIKFAARPLSPNRARELGRTAREIVAQVERAEQACRAAEDAARQAAAEAAARETAELEERARRASRSARGPTAGAGT